MATSRARAFGCGLVLLMTGALEQGAALAGQLAYPAIEVGYRIFNGPNQSSGGAGNLSGSNGYLFNFRAEQRRGALRFNAAAQFEMASGSAGVSAPTASDSYQMYGASFLPGCYVYPFQEGRIQPFAGASAILGWYTMNLNEAYTQSLSMGYEVSAGVDLRFRTGNALTYRIRSAYASHSATVGGNAQGVSLSAFIFSLGIAY